MKGEKIISSVVTVLFKLEISVSKDDAYWYAYIPALEGLHVEGKTRLEAVARAREVARLYIFSYVKHGDPIPLNLANAWEGGKP